MQPFLNQIFLLKIKGERSLFIHKRRCISGLKKATTKRVIWQKKGFNQLHASAILIFNLSRFYSEINPPNWQTSNANTKIPSGINNFFLRQIASNQETIFDILID